MTIAWKKLKPGQRLRVTDIHGDDAVSSRLWEMGLTPGTVITFQGSAPLGDPLELQVRGFRLSVRLNEAERIAAEEIVPQDA